MDLPWAMVFRLILAAAMASFGFGMFLMSIVATVLAFRAPPLRSTRAA